MKDERLEARNEKLNKSINPLIVDPCVNFSKSREEFRLTLRKKKLENYFENKRMKGYKDNIGDHSIEIESCNINEEIKLKMENLQEVRY
jgi:polynucleotide 5'-kinase involved in rRNA processing